MGRSVGQCHASLVVVRVVLCMGLTRGFIYMVSFELMQIDHVQVRLLVSL